MMNEEAKFENEKEIPVTKLQTLLLLCVKVLMKMENKI